MKVFAHPLTKVSHLYYPIRLIDISLDQIEFGGIMSFPV